MDIARSVLNEREVLPGVVRAVPEVRVEAVFDDGTRLAVVRDPFRAGAIADPEPEELAGEVVLDVTNTAAVPISVTSHFHFFEANPRLRFDRAAAYGMHLAVAAGAAVRFEPGGTRRVALPGRRGRCAFGMEGRASLVYCVAKSVGRVGVRSCRPRRRTRPGCRARRRRTPR